MEIWAGKNCTMLLHRDLGVCGGGSMSVSKRPRGRGEKTFRLFDDSATSFFKFEKTAEGRVSTNLLEELDADQLDVTSFLATLNLSLDGRHARWNQPG